MSEQFSRYDLKKRFQAGDKPSEEDFAALIDSAYNRTEDNIAPNEHNIFDLPEHIDDHIFLQFSYNADEGTQDGTQWYIKRNTDNSLLISSENAVENNHPLNLVIGRSSNAMVTIGRCGLSCKEEADVALLSVDKNIQIDSDNPKLNFGGEYGCDIRWITGTGTDPDPDPDSDQLEINSSVVLSGASSTLDISSGILIVGGCTVEGSNSGLTINQPVIVDDDLTIIKKVAIDDTLEVMDNAAVGSLSITGTTQSNGTSTATGNDLADGISAESWIPLEPSETMLPTQSAVDAYVSENALPVGTILLWAGNALESEYPQIGTWQICNGDYDTPDLEDYFPVGSVGSSSSSSSSMDVLAHYIMRTA